MLKAYCQCAEGLQKKNSRWSQHKQYFLQRWSRHVQHLSVAEHDKHSAAVQPGAKKFSQWSRSRETFFRFHQQKECYTGGTPSLRPPWQAAQPGPVPQGTSWVPLSLKQALVASRGKKVRIQSQPTGMMGFQGKAPLKAAFVKLWWNLLIQKKTNEHR